MTIPMHVRVTAIGTLGSGVNERFQYGVNLISTGSASTLRTRWSTAAATDWQTFADLVGSFHASGFTAISPSAVLTSVKLALIGADPANPNRGIYLEPPKEFAKNQPGGAVGNGAVLPQSALAVSLNTPGLNKFKGRFYIPMPVVTVSPSDGWKIAAATVDAIRQEAQTMLNGMRAADIGGIANDLKPAVVSGPTVKDPNRGFATEVSSIRVGRLVDTISSRRRQLGESYVANALLSG